MNNAEKARKGIPIMNIGKPLIAKKSGMGISGSIKVWITRTNDKKELVFEDHNAIQAAYAGAIVDALELGTDMAMDDLFSGNANPPDPGEDGIAIKDSGGLWYEMIMAANVQSGGEITFSGTFTGIGITVADAASVNLGHNYNAPFTRIWAIPSRWASQAVLAAETLTIDWIIKHQAT